MGEELPSQLAPQVQDHLVCCVLEIGFVDQNERVLVVGVGEPFDEGPRFLKSFENLEVIFELNFF